MDGKASGKLAGPLSLKGNEHRHKSLEKWKNKLDFAGLKRIPCITSSERKLLLSEQGEQNHPESNCGVQIPPLAVCVVVDIKQSLKLYSERSC